MEAAILENMVQVQAGRWINFEGLALASQAILRQNMPEHAICQVCQLFPLNSSKILAKSLIGEIGEVWAIAV